MELSLAVAASLCGCGGNATQPVVATSNSSSSSSSGALTLSPPQASTSLQSLFPGYPNTPDLSAPDALPPTEIPDPMRFFGPDPLSLDATGASSAAHAFDHVVVIMMENRAFDHILGYLYPGVTPDGTPFNGVYGKSLSNPIPSYVGGGSVPVMPATVLQTPVIDPSEEWQSVNLALFDAFNPTSNQSVTSESAYQSPYNLPDGGAYFPPPMNGFVKMFVWTLAAANQTSTSESLFETIMQCFTPNLVPVISQLASQFAVCDNWHCGVPSQTYCNRAFFQAASSGGLVDNAPYYPWAFDNTAPTIFDRLSNAGLPWTVYYDLLDVYPLTRLINYPTLSNYPLGAPYFKDMASFYDDVLNGSLPAYSFIQPRFVLENNSYHPYNGAPAVKRGEILLNDIYQAIRQSNSTSGSNYLNTLLVVTFDEGGTCYDHVPPGSAVPPGDGFSGQFNFGFDRQGQRIPAILVSPWIAANTVISAPLDANSVIKTLQTRHGLPSLTARDAASTPLTDVVTLSGPRSRSEMPRLRVRTLSATEALPDQGTPLNDLQTAIVGLACTIETGTEGQPPDVKTIGDALTYLASVKIK